MWVRSASWTGACFCVAVGTSSVADAAQWEVKPRIKAREVYTDNVRLAPSGQEQSDFVTEVEPGIRVRGTGARLQLEADYAFQQRWYRDHKEGNGHNHLLNSKALWTAWERNLFVEAAANIAQQNVSPVGSLATSNVNITDNRTEVRQLSLSPYWVSRLGPWANLQARYSITRADYTREASALDTDSEVVSVVISNGPSFQNLSWKLSYTDQKVDLTGGQFDRRDLESVTAEAAYRLLPTLSILGSVGYEDNSYGTTRGSISGSFWNAGFEWTPSTRTRVKATAGERFFGQTYALEALHRTRLTTWNIGYSEQLITTPSAFTLPAAIDTATILNNLFISQFPDPAQRQLAVQAFIAQMGLPSTLLTSVNFLSNQVSLSKRLNAGFALRGVRTTFILNAFHEKRTSENEGSTTSLLGTDPFLISDSVVQTGYTAVLNWRFSPRTSASLEHTLSRNRFSELGREDTINTVRLSLTHQLQRRLQGGLGYQFSDRDSDAANFGYRENAVIGTLSLQF